MDRTKIIEAIVNVSRVGSRAGVEDEREWILRESLKRIASDLTLLSLAQDLGIDTNEPRI